MELKLGINFIKENEIAIVRQNAEQKKYKVYDINASCKHTIFENIKSKLPLDPPLVSNHVWDALLDSLFEGLSLEKSDEFLLICHETHEYKINHPSDYVIFLDVLKSVSDGLFDSENTAGNPKNLYIIMVE